MAFNPWFYLNVHTPFHAAMERKIQLMVPINDVMIAMHFLLYGEIKVMYKTIPISFGLWK